MGLLFVYMKYFVRSVFDEAFQSLNFKCLSSGAAMTDAVPDKAPGENRLWSN